ncbi:MAG TPA: hypothetical protein VN154_00280 [Rhizomicrobium sp.]|nr:hypothetical protein [Rhizomicrobium sp.]
MTDTHPVLGSTIAASDNATERLRTYSIVIYVLYLLSLPSAFLTFLIGAIVAYFKRGEARDTIFESHFANAIEVFWVALVVGLVAIALWPLFFLGALIHAVLLVWVLYRTIKGLLRAIEGRAYG